MEHQCGRGSECPSVVEARHIIIGNGGPGLGERHFRLSKAHYALEDNFALHEKDHELHQQRHEVLEGKMDKMAVTIKRGERIVDFGSFLIDYRIGRLLLYTAIVAVPIAAVIVVWKEVSKLF